MANEERIIPFNDGTKRYLNQYTEMLLEGLTTKGIIRLLDEKKEGKELKYQLAKVKEGANVHSEVSLDGKSIFQDFYDFRNVAFSVFQNVRRNNAIDADVKTLSEVCFRLIEYGAIRDENKKIISVKDFLDSADDLLVDEELKSSAVLMLNENKINFNELVMSLLKFHSRHLVTKYFMLEIENIGEDRSDFPVDFIASILQYKLRLLVDTKYRKGKFDVKDILQQSAEELRRQNSLFNSNNHILVFVYTYENGGEIERTKFKVRRNLETLFWDLEPYVHIIPIQIGNFSSLETELVVLRNELFSSEFDTRFLFSNQIPDPENPHIDDHYCPRVFKLENQEYRIKFRANKFAEHWRFGVKFSVDGFFPPRELRHLPSHPVFHLERDLETNGLIKYSLYNDPVTTLSNRTSVTNYQGEPLTIKLKKHLSNTIIEVFDSNEMLILKQQIIRRGFSYFMIFAWADGKNPFEFEALIFNPS